MNLLKLFLYPLFVLITSDTHYSNRQEEYLRVRRISYQKLNNKVTVQLEVTDQIWYQDSIGITQLSGIGLERSDSAETYFPIPLGYRLVDMRRKWVYEYLNLSDTAMIIKKYGKADSVEMEGGWNFFRTAAIKFDSLSATGDTIINGVTFQRHSLVQDFQGAKLPGEVLTRCDRKGTIFHLDVGLSNAAGCPVVKGTAFKKDGKYPTSSVEIEFVSNEIPDSVRRVFAAWKLNMEKFPVE